MKQFIALVTVVGLLFVTGCEKKKDTAEYDKKGSMELKYAQ